MFIPSKVTGHIKDVVMGPRFVRDERQKKRTQLGTNGSLRGRHGTIVE